VPPPTCTEQLPRPPGVERGRFIRPRRTLNSSGFRRLSALAASAKNPTGCTLTKSLCTSQSTELVPIRQKLMFKNRIVPDVAVRRSVFR
jgi:hypothetical protein